MVNEFNKGVISTETVDGFLGIDTQLNVSDKPLEEAIEIIADIVNGTYTIEQLRRDIEEWEETWTVITHKSEHRPAPLPPMSPFETTKETIKSKMLKANKARTDILADNPDINSNWTPNAIDLLDEIDGNN
jgi:hypothetical protein